jgi:class 3 adenylate cyclase
MKETRLAAVMFTDIANFSEMMEKDEKRTIDLLDDHNRILLPLIANFSGTLIDSIGDGLLVTFDSVFSAVSCALNIQNAVSARNADAGDPFHLRIGVHLGDIWVEGKRIYGNGVNIASRIQNLARPGGICISEDVYYQVKNKDVIQVEEIPSPNLKNISRDIKVYHLLTGLELPAPVPGAPAPASPVDPAPAADDGDDTDLGSRLEKRIGDFVEKTLDVALGAWESTPSEVKDEVLSEIRNEDWYVDLEEDPDDSPLARSIKGRIRSAVSGKIREGMENASITVSRDGEGGKKIVTIASPGGLMSGNSDKGKKEKDEPDESLGTIIWGIVATTGFSLGVIYNGSGWFWFLLFLLGILPLGMGIMEYIKALGKKRRRLARKKEQVEKETLDCARSNGGRLTVVQLAHCTGMSMDEAQRELDRLSARNWVQQTISDDGVLYYDFPALLPDGSSD